MSRALRRHPTKTKKQRQARSVPPRPTTPRQPPREQGEGRGLIGLLQPHWAMDIISELRKVTWPSLDDTRYLTIVVLVVATAFGIFLGGVDMLFNWMIDNTLLR